MWWLYFVSSVLGYLLGSVPTGYLVGRYYGIDIREHGSKNMGATNVVRVLGKKPGYFVFICDALKGLLAVRLAVWYVYQAGQTASEIMLRDAAAIGGALDPHSHGEDIHLVLAGIDARLAGVATLAGIIAALACILGHNFPVWLRFKGGKGVATTVGVLLGLMPVAVAITAVVWNVTYFTTRYVSLASLLGAAVLPVSVWFLTMRHGPPPGPPWLFYFSLLAAALIFWRHRANIGRLLNGTEARFTRKPSPSTPEP